LGPGQGGRWQAAPPARLRPAHEPCGRGGRPGQTGSSPPPARPPRPAPDADAGPGEGEAGSPSRAAPASPPPPPSPQGPMVAPGPAAAAVGGRLVTDMLGLSLRGGCPPPAAPAAATATRLVRVTTPAKIQHQERDRGHGASAATGLVHQAACDEGLPAHAASPPLGSWPPRARWRRWRARSIARSSSTVAGSWRRRWRASWAAARWQDRQ
jgi:hypothetical protein